MKVTTDIQGNLFISMRERVCAELCPGGRHCKNLKCMPYIFGLIGEIEEMIEADHEHTHKS